jgi:hypothetical protein
MTDIFPDPAGGFHLGGLVGVSFLGLKDDQENSSNGLGLSVWGGHQWWASSQWSVGGLVRLSAAWSARKVDGVGRQHDASDVTRAITLMFSAVYH